MRFGELLQEIRVSKRISLRELSQKVKLSAAYLSDIERGLRKPPSIQLILKIAQALETDPEPLLRAALRERDVLELPLNQNFVRTEAALALARRWEHLSEETLKTITALLEQQSEED